MERFRLRILNQPKRGDVWELKLFPDRPDHLTREADGRVLGTCTNPEAIYWLRQIAAPLLGRALDPAPIGAGPLPPVVGSAARPHPAADSFSARSDPRWLHPEDGMRLALAFSAAKYLVTAEQRGRFQEGLAELPSEVILYWFTLCYYGYRQAAGKAALRTLLTHEEPTPPSRASTREKASRDAPAGPDLFAASMAREPEGEEEPEEPKPAQEKADCVACGRLRLIVRDGLCWTCNNEWEKEIAAEPPASAPASAKASAKSRKKTKANSTTGARSAANLTKNTKRGSSRAASGE